MPSHLVLLLAILFCLVQRFTTEPCCVEIGEEGFHSNKLRHCFGADFWNRTFQRVEAQFWYYRFSSLHCLAEGNRSPLTARQPGFECSALKGSLHGTPDNRASSLVWVNMARSRWSRGLHPGHASWLLSLDGAGRSQCMVRSCTLHGVGID